MSLRCAKAMFFRLLYSLLMHIYLLIVCTTYLLSLGVLTTRHLALGGKI